MLKYCFVNTKSEEMPYSCRSKKKKDTRTTIFEVKGETFKEKEHEIKASIQPQIMVHRVQYNIIFF